MSFHNTLLGLIIFLAAIQVESGWGTVKRKFIHNPTSPIQNSQKLVQTMNTRKAEADRLLEQGNQQHNTRQFQAALEFFQQALRIYREIGDRSGEASALDRLGWTYRRLNQYSQALNYFQQALAISREIGDLSGEAKLLRHIRFLAEDVGDLGYSLEDLGQYQRSIEFIELSLAIYRDLGDRNNEARLLNFLAWLHLSLGQYQQSIELNQQSIAILRKMGYAYDLQLADIGLAYQALGQYQQAIDLAQQALAIARDRGNARVEAFVLNDLGNAYYYLGQYKKAVEFHQQAVARAPDRFHRWTVVSLNDLGRAYHALGEYQQAMKFHGLALSISRDKGFRAVEGAALSYIGDLLAQQNQPQLAIIFYKQSVNVTESIRKDIQGLPTEQQRSYTETVAGTYRRLADLLLKQDRILEAQQVLDLLKVQELEDYLRNIRGNEQTAQGVSATPPEQQIQQGYEAILDKAIQFGKELAQLESIPPANRTSAQQQRIVELRKNEQEISQQFAEFLKSPTVTALVAQLRQVTGGETLNLANFNSLRDNLQKLQQNAVVLYPFVLDDRLELVLVTPFSPPIRRTVTIKREELNRAIVEFRRDLSDPGGDIADAKTSAQKLYNLLIKPIENDLAQADAKTIIYAPDGQLRYIPLAALHDGKQWLVQRFRINNITAASLTDFNTKPQTNLQVLAAAFTRASYNFRVGTRDFTMSGLPFAGREVENLAATIPDTKKLLDNQFNRDTVLLMNDYSIVHLATHAAFVSGEPEDSFIMFGNGDRATLREIKTWSLPKVDLIVLSACQTAFGGTLGNGEEILGFGYQIQRTGARAAIASLWFVDDGGTQVLMDAFYAALKQENITKAEALRQAQIALITGQPANSSLPPKLSNHLSHPFYWAPFILIGNGL